MVLKFLYGIAITSIFIILILYFLHPVTNLVGDLGYYLKIGEVIVTTHSIPNTNLFSYTSPTYPFINMNWISEVAFYLIQNKFGFDGLIIVSVLLSVGTFGLIFIIAQKKYGLLPTLLLSLLSLQIVYERTDIKPELFSYFFFATFLFILFQFKKTYTKLIFLLIPLELLWTNMHIYFFIGNFLLLFFFLDAFKDDHYKIFSKKTKTLLFVTVVSFFTTLVNPFFIKGALYPFFVLGNYGFKVAENIDYLTAINVYKDPTFFFFGMSVLVIFLGVLLNIKKFSLLELCLLSFFTILGFFAVRTFPLFVIGTFIPSAHILFLFIQQLEKSYGKKVHGCALGLFYILLLILVPTVQSNIALHEVGVGMGVKNNAKPAITFLKENQLHGPIYNNYNIGSYLVYELYPQEHVFADARPEAYPKEFFQSTYVPMEISPSAFKKYADIYKFNIIVWQYTEFSDESNAFITSLIKNKDWKFVYLNSEVVIFVKDTKSNQKIIASHPINKKTVLEKIEDANTKTQVGNYVNLFRLLGWEDSWLVMNKRYLEYDPQNCAVLQNIAYILQQKKSQEFEMYLNKYIQTCRK